MVTVGNVKCFGGVVVVAALMMGGPSQALTENEKNRLEAFPREVIETACNEEKLMKICFHWGKEECLEQSLKQAQNCVRAHKDKWTKNALDTAPYTLEQWQNKLIDCTYKNLKSQNRSRRVASVECN